MSLSDFSGLWVLALAAFIVGRLTEWRIHRRNYGALCAMGAIELSPWLMRGYYGLTVAVVPAAFLEQILAPSVPTRGMLFVGSALAGGAILLRLWAIRSLGSFWTMRCMALPGIRLHARGPYRILDNPEYFSRIIEGAGISLLLSAEVTLAVYVTVIAGYGVFLAGMEREHLEAVARTP